MAAGPSLTPMRCPAAWPVNPRRAPAASCSGAGLTKTSSRSGPNRRTTRSQKYVASMTLKEPLGWRNSTLLQGDACDAVAGLKQQDGKDLVVLGSGELVQGLMRRNLVDEYVLLITLSSSGRDGDCLPTVVLW